MQLWDGVSELGQEEEDEPRGSLVWLHDGWDHAKEEVTNGRVLDRKREMMVVREERWVMKYGGPFLLPAGFSRRSPLLRSRTPRGGQG